MMKSVKDNILDVFNRKQPEVVPGMLDLSLWFAHKNKLAIDPAQSDSAPDPKLLDIHSESGIGFYLPQSASLFSVEYPDSAVLDITKKPVKKPKEARWKLTTPQGEFEKVETWDEKTYFWNVTKWQSLDKKALDILTFAMKDRQYSLNKINIDAWLKAIGDSGILYCPLGNSAIGTLIEWLGVQQTADLIKEEPKKVTKYIETVNANFMKLVDVIGKSAVNVVLMGEDIPVITQLPEFAQEMSWEFYQEAITRLHEAGKYSTIRVSGKLKGVLSTAARLGADCVDSVSPGELSGLSATECRVDAGQDLILMGGIPAELWKPETPLAQFEQAVTDWLELKEFSARLICSSGGPLPPGADEKRFTRFNELIAEQGIFV